MAKNELKRIEATTTGDITITECGLRLGDSWTDLDDVFKKALGLKSDETIEPIKFNGKITIIVEEVGNTSNNLIFKSTMVDCDIVVDDMTFERKMSENAIAEILDYMKDTTRYNSKIYITDSTRASYSEIQAITVASGQFAGTYEQAVKPITIE